MLADLQCTVFQSIFQKTPFLHPLVWPLLLMLQACILQGSSGFPPQAEDADLTDRSADTVEVDQADGSDLLGVDLTDQLFDPDRVGRMELTLDPDALEQLQVEPREYVSATLSYISPDGETQGPFDVGLRLKGGAGSFRPLEDKPAFKVLMDFSVDDQRLFGLKRLTLNNLVQDPTMIREALVYGLFRDFEVPAPRIGYLQITLNDQDYGLYANVETPDRTFLSRWFDSTAHLYEGEYGADLRPNGIDAFEVDVGDENDHTGYDALVSALASSPPDDVLTATGQLVDWDEVLRMMAIEIWSGHWDAYAPSANNYFFHEDEDGRFSLIPWGADQAFTQPMDLHRGQSVLLRRCMADLACLERYNQTLLELQELLDEAALAARAESLAESLADPIAADRRKPFSDQEVQEGLAGLHDFLSDRTRFLLDQTPCLDGSIPDRDSDGYICDMDCNDDDPDIHVGAAELCDGIDQDCNGEPDDRPECPDCTRLERNGHDYLVCTRFRPRPEAADRCLEDGMHLVKVETQEENLWLAEQAQAIRPGRYWIGLMVPLDSDSDQYLWPDGTPPEYTPWAEEPEEEQYGGRCAVMLESGDWLPVYCGFPARTLCEE
ncbi:MAG: CotH kinase family protein [Bradymonadales bacterium]|nr:CotH kinase family protein [Bradymonadales bacterium]